MNKVSSKSYYSEYHGHKVRHLQIVLNELRGDVNTNTNTTTTTGSNNPLSGTTNTNTLNSNSNSIIWTAGDSSIDNKYWFPDTVPAIPNSVYERILEPPIMKPDVPYWLNVVLKELQIRQQQQQVQNEAISSTTNTPISTTTTPLLLQINSKVLEYNGVINTAVEATTINERTFRLRDQDILLQQNIRSNDIVLVSIGGNDVALHPVPCTIVSIACLVYCIPTGCIENPIQFLPPCPFDDKCYGCGPSLLSCCTTCPPCLGYFRHYYQIRIEKYLQRIIPDNIDPYHVVLAMIYYPDENSTVPSWANVALNILQYNKNPAKLQAIIRSIHTHAIQQIRLKNHPTTRLTTVPFYTILNGKDTSDYKYRVEPSPSGGKKLAELLLHNIFVPNSSISSLPPLNTNNNNNRSIPFVSRLFSGCFQTKQSTSSPTTTTSTSYHYQQHHQQHHDNPPQSSVMVDRS